MLYIKVFLLAFFLLAVITVVWFFVVETHSLPHSQQHIPQEEHASQKTFHIIIYPYTHFLKQLPTFSPDDKVVVVNQTEKSLGFENEFKVTNPNLTIKELEEIGRNLVPRDATINFIYI